MNSTSTGIGLAPMARRLKVLAYHLANRPVSTGSINKLCATIVAQDM